MLRAAIFDIDNTLYSYDAAHGEAWRAVTDYAVRAFSITSEQFEDWHRAGSKLLEAHSGGRCAAIHNRLIRYQLMLEAVGQPIAHAPAMAKLYWNALLDAMTPFPGVYEAFERIRSMGMTIGIGTNMTADWQYAKLERLGMTPFMDFIVTSEEAGVEKPDARLFELCAQKAGGAMSECAFVGDSLKSDALGARDAGMRAIWLDRGQAPVETPEGVVRIQTLAELPALLDIL